MKTVLLPSATEKNAYVFDVPAGLTEIESAEIDVPHDCARLLIRIGARSDISLRLLITGDAEVTHETDITLEDESCLRLLCIQECGSSATVSIRQRTRIGNGPRLTMQNVSLGGHDVAHDLVSTITGNDATSSVDWMFYATGTERQKLSARNVFDGRNGAGEILMKGVAQDKAHTAANGLIEIGLKGGGTNTYLTQDVLMLDSSAKVDAVPGLEIKTNDVKASHSATVSRVTAEDLFYFGARGIPQTEAKRMYVLGFLGQITGRLPQGTWSDRILESIEAKYSAAR